LLKNRRVEATAVRWSQRLTRRPRVHSRADSAAAEATPTAASAPDTAKKSDPQERLEVHHQYRYRDDRCGGIGSLRHNACEEERPLRPADSSFNRYARTLIAKCLLRFFEHLGSTVVILMPRSSDSPQTMVYRDTYVNQQTGVHPPAQHVISIRHVGGTVMAEALRVIRS